MSKSHNPPPQPALITLIRPTHILSLFRHHPERKTYYFEGCNKLWSRILTQPPSSPAHQQAYRGLITLTRTINEALARQKEEAEKKRKEEKAEAERISKAQEQQSILRARALRQQQQYQHPQKQTQTQRIPPPPNNSLDPEERAAFRALVSHIATRDGIPSIADFEAGLTAFTHLQYGSSSDRGIVDDVVSEQDAKLARDDVETALELLRVNVDEVSVEDVYASLTLLDLKMSVRVEEYLAEMEKGRM